MSKISGFVTVTIFGIFGTKLHHFSMNGYNIEVSTSFRASKLPCFALQPFWRFGLCIKCNNFGMYGTPVPDVLRGAFHTVADLSLI